MTDPNGNVKYTVYDAPDLEVRVYPGFDASTGTTTGPIQVRSPGTIGAEGTPRR
ncbi:hypothetical protein [Fimbriiglobus ruber]|uniref:Rhs family protein n=1 Tax=Fimbriiglobus ruber TaxID=1908690 RepID=A0A225DNP4_9BACT|nr:hypothetical protein [Fimbriiglobus ruber]OWK39096.1 Rhs family protein [Fimbriiglobus ruber]